MRTKQSLTRARYKRPSYKFPLAACGYAHTLAGSYPYRSVLSGLGWVLCFAGVLDGRWGYEIIYSLPLGGTEPFSHYTSL